MTEIKGFKPVEPVLNNDNKPCWLVFKGNKSDTITAPIKPTYELEPMGVFQCRKCGCIIRTENGEMPLECYEDQGGCNRTTNFNIIAKPIKKEFWKLPKWKDIPIEELNLPILFDDLQDMIKKLVVFSDDIEYKIFTLWIISTWKLESWDSVGFPVFIGIPNSGKSRALQIISELSYRAVKSSGVTAAVIPRLCHYWNVTLTIDEAHNKLNPRYDTGSQFLDFIKDSYKKGSVYLSCDNDNQENIIVTKNFGFKAFAGEKTFNPALLTRSFVFWMEKENPEIAKLSYVEEELEQFRTKLLNYKIKTNEPEDLGNEFVLKGRTREIFESIIATGKHIGIEVKDIIEHAKKQDISKEEELQGTIQFEILKIIKDHQGDATLFPDDAPTSIKTENILTQLNWITGDKKDDNISRQKLGYILRDMGITTKRGTEGRIILLQDDSNEKRLTRLYKRYKL